MAGARLPLAMLRGVDGQARSLIERSWEAATAVAGPGRVWVATDDARIAEAVRAFGGQVVMTPESCRNGTERCAAALEVLGDVAPIMVNLQGDAPLTPAFVVEDLVKALADDDEAVMATPAVRCSETLYRHLVTDQAQGRVGGTTVVFNAARRALYFSKRVIPHMPDGLADAHRQAHLHLGVYAYRPEALRAYAATAPSPDARLTTVLGDWLDARLLEKATYRDMHDALESIALRHLLALQFEAEGLLNHVEIVYAANGLEHGRFWPARRLRIRAGKQPYAKRITLFFTAGDG